tara:strand:- start:12602 stop:12853 length:252 start_codon:yes stop_codon:yes gene_type:complete
MSDDRQNETQAHRRFYVRVRAARRCAGDFDAYSDERRRHHVNPERRIASADNDIADDELHRWDCDSNALRLSTSPNFIADREN